MGVSTVKAAMAACALFNMGAASATTILISGQFNGTASANGPIYGATYTSTLTFDENVHDAPYSTGGAGMAVSYGDGQNAAGNWFGTIQLQGYGATPASTMSFDVPISVIFQSQANCAEGPCSLVNVESVGSNGGFIAYLTLKTVDMTALGGPLLPSILPTDISYFETRVTMQSPQLGQGNDFNPALATAAEAVPEPSTWAMMVGGFGLIGGALRRRKVNVSFA